MSVDIVMVRTASAFVSTLEAPWYMNPTLALPRYRAEFSADVTTDHHCALASLNEQTYPMNSSSGNAMLAPADLLVDSETTSIRSSTYMVQAPLNDCIPTVA